MRRSTKVITAVALCLGMSGTGYVYMKTTDKPIIILNAPDTYAPGELVVLDASKSGATELAWQIIPSTVNFKIIGRKAMFSDDGSQKEYLVIISGSLGGKVDCIIHRMTLGNSIDIKKLSILETMMKNWLPEDRTHDEVIRLAQSFRSVARIIEASNLTNIDEIIQATAWSNADALGNSVEKWKPFLSELQTYLENNPPSNHAQQWREIAQALESVGKLPKITFKGK